MDYKSVLDKNNTLVQKYSPQVYKATKGETLESIGKSLGVSYQAMVTANPAFKTTRFEGNEIIAIPKKKYSIEKQASESQQVKMDTTKYDTLIKDNQKKLSSDISDIIKKREKTISDYGVKKVKLKDNYANKLLKQGQTTIKKGINRSSIQGLVNDQLIKQYDSQASQLQVTQNGLLKALENKISKKVNDSAVKQQKIIEQKKNALIKVIK